MAFSFACPYPCSHKITVEAKNRHAAIDKILEAGAIKCRNKYYRCSCERANLNLNPMQAAELRSIIRLCMQEE